MTKPRAKVVCSFRQRAIVSKVRNREELFGMTVANRCAVVRLLAGVSSLRGPSSCQEGPAGAFHGGPACYEGEALSEGGLVRAGPKAPPEKGNMLEHRSS